MVRRAVKLYHFPMVFLLSFLAQAFPITRGKLLAIARWRTVKLCLVPAKSFTQINLWHDHKIIKRNKDGFKPRELRPVMCISRQFHLEYFALSDWIYLTLYIYLYLFSIIYLLSVYVFTLSPKLSCLIVVFAHFRCSNYKMRAARAARLFSSIH